MAGLQGQARAGDTTLTFTGLCDNASCSASGANGTVPGAVSATITFTDLSWQAMDSGGYELVASDAFNFGYAGPNSFVRLGDGDPLNGEQSHFYSTTASLDGLYDFKIIWGQAPQGMAPGLGFLSGNASGWRWDGYTLLNVGGFLVLSSYDIHRSTQSWQWAVATVPEPASYGMWGLGLGLLGWAARRRPREA